MTMYIGILRLVVYILGAPGIIYLVVRWLDNINIKHSNDLRISVLFIITAWFKHIWTFNDWRNDWGDKITGEDVVLNRVSYAKRHATIQRISIITTDLYFRTHEIYVFMHPSSLSWIPELDKNCRIIINALYGFRRVFVCTNLENITTISYTSTSPRPGLYELDMTPICTRCTTGEVDIWPSLARYLHRKDDRAKYPVLIDASNVGLI